MKPHAADTGGSKIGNQTYSKRFHRHLEFFKGKTIRMIQTFFKITVYSTQNQKELDKFLTNLGHIKLAEHN